MLRVIGINHASWFLLGLFNFSFDIIFMLVFLIMKHLFYLLVVFRVNCLAAVQSNHQLVSRLLLESIRVVRVVVVRLNPVVLLFAGW